MDIRRAVFIVEQDVPEDLEVDGLDGDARHVLAVDDADAPLATARVRFVDDAAKIERVAVLKAARGRGVGQGIMRWIVNALSGEDSVAKLKLGSQTHAVKFYEKLGFEKHGAEYMDAGIPHYAMVLDITNTQEKTAG